MRELTKNEEQQVEIVVNMNRQLKYLFNHKAEDINNWVETINSNLGYKPIDMVSLNSIKVMNILSNYINIAYYFIPSQSIH